ncbi:MAG: tetratricopeptide repeat protein [Pseudomonadales bacterium]|nr:tetratricopeptide repeat protein [Pseudomonadales bacterium]
MKRLLKCILILPLGWLLAIETVAAKESPPTVSPYIYKQLNQAQQKIDSGAPEQALLILDKIIRQQRSSTYEKALAQQTSGLLYYQQQQIAEAIKRFTLAVNSDALPLQAAQQTRFNLAQLYLSEQQYDAAIKTINQWLALSEKPTGEVYLLLASGYSADHQYQAAIKPAELAIKLLNSPTESHYRFLLGLYFETENYDLATTLLEQLILKFPSHKEYWLQLASLYSQKHRDKDSLVITEMAYQKGLLNRDDEIVRLTQLLLHLQYPHKAARILEQEMAAGTVKSSQQNQELLATAWFNAREYQKALIPLKSAARKSTDGTLYLRLAQAQFELEQFQDAISSLNQALSKGDLKHPDTAHLLNGIAHYQLGKFKQAINEFQKASQFDRSRDQAKQWVNYLNQKQNSS